MKKIKGHKCSPSNPSHPSHQTRPVGLVVMCEHWTPKGDCKVTGHKESQPQEICQDIYLYVYKFM